MKKWTKKYYVSDAEKKWPENRDLAEIVQTYSLQGNDFVTVEFWDTDHPVFFA